jgi:metal-responsive CopG/Arc/MetJ family transcriptional regulator
MRTTVEITDAQRARLLELAARRGEKGFSKLVQDALDRYIDELEEHDRRVKDALSVLGKLDEKTARELEGNIKHLRKTWR